MKIDPVSLTADLIRCPSVTPEEGGSNRIIRAFTRDEWFSARGSQEDK